MTLAVSQRNRSLSTPASAGRAGSVHVVIALGRRAQVRHERQQDAERRSGSGHAAEVDAAAMVLHDLVRDGEPEPGPRLLGGEERIEDTVGERGRNSRAAVHHLDLYATVEGPPDARRRIAFVA